MWVDDLLSQKIQIQSKYDDIQAFGCTHTTSSYFIVTFLLNRRNLLTGRLTENHYELISYGLFVLHGKLFRSKARQT